jgi:hypothetical protein
MLGDFVTNKSIHDSIVNSSVLITKHFRKHEAPAIYHVAADFLSSKSYYSILTHMIIRGAVVCVCVYEYRHCNTEYHNNSVDSFLLVINRNAPAGIRVTHHTAFIIIILRSNNDNVPSSCRVSLEVVQATVDDNNNNKKEKVNDDRILHS